MNRLAIIAFTAGTLGFAIHFLAIPRMHAFDEPCQDAVNDIGSGWVVIRGPQSGPAVLLFEEKAGRTLIVPGCSHWNAGIAIWVDGDQRDLASTSNLVLAAHGVTGETAENTTFDAEPGNPVRVLEGTFTTVSPITQWWALAIGFALVPAGLFLVRHNKLVWAIPPAIGGLVGALFGYLVQRTALPGNIGIIASLIVTVPFWIFGMRMLAQVPLVKSRTSRALACLALAAAIAVAVWVFAGIFPRIPET